jgi:hypothetical protein
MMFRTEELAMIQFEHTGHDPLTETPVRRVAGGAFLILEGILLFPLVILGFFLWSLWLLLTRWQFMPR